MLSYFIVRRLPIRNSRRVATYALCAAAGLWTTACLVSKGRYDAAVASATTERKAHLVTQQRLETLEQKLASAREELAQRKSLLQTQDDAAARMEREVAAHELAKDVLTVERQEQAEIVEQLRGELARVGTHLRDFAEQKSQLATALEDAEARATKLVHLEQEAEVRATVVRELTLALAEPLRRGDIKLSLTGGRPVIQIPANRMFSEDYRALNVHAKSLLETIGKTLAPIQPTRVEVGERGGQQTAEDQMARLQLIVESLAASGLAFERVVYSLSAFDESRAPNGTETATPASDADAAAPPTRVDVAVEIVSKP